MDPCSTPRTSPEFCCLVSLSLHLAGLELGPLRNSSQDLILLATRACTFSDGRDLCRMPFILREHASAPPAIAKGSPEVSSDTRKIPSNTRWCIASSGTITEMRRKEQDNQIIVWDMQQQLLVKWDPRISDGFSCFGYLYRTLRVRCVACVG